MVVGIDVGKAHLDVHIAPTGEARQFPNDAGGRRGLRKMLKKNAGIELVVVEATAAITGHCTRACTPAVSRWQ